jgi:hypothetical protein
VARLFRKHEILKHEKHVLHGVTTIHVVMKSSWKLGPAAEDYLQSQVTGTCSTGVLEGDMWLHIAGLYMSTVYELCLGPESWCCVSPLLSQHGKE